MMLFSACNNWSNHNEPENTSKVDSHSPSGVTTKKTKSGASSSTPPPPPRPPRNFQEHIVRIKQDLADFGETYVNDLKENLPHSFYGHYANKHVLDCLKGKEFQSHLTRDTIIVFYSIRESGKFKYKRILNSDLTIKSNPMVESCISEIPNVKMSDEYTLDFVKPNYLYHSFFIVENNKILP